MHNTRIPKGDDTFCQTDSGKYFKVLVLFDNRIIAILIGIGKLI